MASCFGWRRGEVVVTDSEVVITDSVWVGVKKLFRQSKLFRLIIILGVIVFGVSLALPSARSRAIRRLLVGAAAIGVLYLFQQLAPIFIDITNNTRLQRDTIDFVELHTGGRIAAPKVFFVKNNGRKRPVYMSLVHYEGAEEFEAAQRVLESAGFVTRRVD